MKINKNKFKSIIASVFLLVLVIGAAYAYLGTFNVDLSNDIAVNINSTSPGNTAFVANATQLNLQVPSSSMGSYLANNTVAAMENNAVLNVSLQGANGFKTTCTYDIVYEYDSSSLVYGSSNAPVTSGATKEITLQIENVTGTNYYETERNFNYYTGSYNDNANDKWTSTTKRTLVSGATITSVGITKKQSINVIGRYYNLDAYQDLGGKAFNGTIYVENVNCELGNIPGYDTILLNNGGQDAIEIKETPDFSQIADTDEGMFAAKDDLGTSYYFRGAVNNNWIKFGQENGIDIYWRIIRINGDNSIRIIYSGTTAPTSDSSVVMSGTETTIGRTMINKAEVSATSEYVGYMYTESQQHGTQNASVVMEYIDNWFENKTNLKNSSLIADSIFCNDRSVIDGSWVSSGFSFHYASFTRNQSLTSPTLLCDNINDRFTVNNSIGNAALNNPVGLITADEVAYAGGKHGTANANYYLQNGQWYWTMSPGDYTQKNDNESGIFQYAMMSNGGINVPGIIDDYYIRPVINLSSDVVLTGNGTWNNPYKVVS